MQDELFEQMANISKAHAYDIVSKQVGELKEIIRQLIPFAEDYEVGTQEAADHLTKLINKAKIAAL